MKKENLKESLLGRSCMAVVQLGDQVEFVVGGKMFLPRRKGDWVKSCAVKNNYLVFL